jgi:hypothetical protein
VNADGTPDREAVVIRLVVRPTDGNESPFWAPSAQIVAWDVLAALKGHEFGGYQITESWVADQ